MVNAETRTPSPIVPGGNDEGLRSHRTFTALMRAMAEPGRIETLTAPPGVPAALSPAIAAVVQALADFETPLWLDEALACDDAVASYLRFVTGAPITAEPAKAAFALVSNAAELPAFSTFAQGSDAYPDRSATIVIEVQSFASNQSFSLTGPGIETSRTFSAGPLPADFAERMSANRALFPCGVDLILTCGDSVTALPRSTRLSSLGEAAAEHHRAR